jgi:hypothetical protein
MSVFVDTGVFYRHHDTDAARHEAAVDGLERLFEGEFGVAYTSDYIIDEAVTLTRVQGGSPRLQPWEESAHSLTNRFSTRT